MDTERDRTAQAVPETVDRELGMIEAAIAMVASGGSDRVVLGGLHFGEHLLPEARRLAAASGVEVVPLWNAQSEGAGLAIERRPE